MPASIRHLVNAVRLAPVHAGRYPGRAPDGWLCSFPSSGRTWTTFILADYLRETRNLAEPLDLDSVFGFVPSADRPGGLRQFSFENRPDVPLIVRSHLRPRPWRFHGARVALLLRDPRDALVSYWHELTTHQARWSGPLEAFLADRSLGVYYYADWVNRWASARGVGPVLVTTYEQLAADPASTMAAVLAHMGERVDAAALRRACDAGRFDRMRDMELASADSRHGPDSRRMRRGPGGPRRSELSEAQTTEMEEQLNHWLSAPAHGLMARAGLWPCA
jgi:hypothetical protein